MARRRRRGLPRWRRPAYEHRHFQHAWEAQVIREALAGGAATAVELTAAYPDRFNLRYLNKALARMHKHGELKRTRARRMTPFYRRTGLWRYGLPGAA